MKFFCNSQDLLNAVNIVSKAVAKNSINPILEGVLLFSKDGRLFVQGNNLELAVETSIAADIEQEGGVVLNCTMLFNIMRRLPNDVVAVSLNDRNNVSVSCASADYKIIGFSAQEFPEIPETAVISEMKMKSSELKDILNKTMFAISFKDNKPVLTGSLFEIENNLLNVVAVDGFRLALKKKAIPETNQFARFIIPGTTQNEIVKILPESEDEDIELGFGNRHAVIKSGSFLIVTRLIEGEFWAYKQIIPAEFKFEVELDSLEFLRGLERAEPIIEDYAKNPILLILNDGNIRIKCETRNGQVNDLIKCDYRGEEMEIGFNYKYLHDAAARCDDEKIVFSGNSPLNPVVIKQKDKEDLLYMVVPVRVKQ